MRCGHFDCFSGAAGDMILGALIDAGCSLETMRETGNVELEKLEALHSPELKEKYLDDYSRGDRKANLKAGIILITIAITLWLFMRFFVIELIGGPAGLQLVGLFPGLLGLAFLFIHYTCQPKDEDTPNG